MNIFIKGTLVLLPLISFGQHAPFQLREEKFEKLPFGAVKPTGWIKAQMEKDMRGFAGHLDQIVPDLVNDPIYSARLHKHSKAKDLGNLKEGDIGGDDQYKWWNSETQSNWRDGFIRNALLLDNAADKKRVKQYVDRILATQDSDGYLGIYDPELRYRFVAENGELWAKTTLLRGLLAYYEATQDSRVWAAIRRAVDDVLKHYSIHHSNPFLAGKEFSGGVAHGLTFTDICDEMYRLTKDKKYRAYALFLYQNFSANFSFEKDVQWSSIFNPNYKLSGHGVHTYEHLRPLTVAAFSTHDPKYDTALSIYLKRVQDAATIAGGPIGDEWIGGRNANATQTGYEYCSLQELLDSYAGLLQKTGAAGFADQIENTFFNAALGARDPEHSCIAYLKTDNSYAMTGPLNGGANGDLKQTRYKYSPAHKDAAVCCVPNAARITPYYVQNMWMKQGDSVLAATLLGPSRVQTKINGANVEVIAVTDYPYDLTSAFSIRQPEMRAFTLKIRRPAWANAVEVDQPYKEEDGFIVIRKMFKKNDRIRLKWHTQVADRKDANGAHYFIYGPLVYAHPIPAVTTAGTVYTPRFKDYLYTPREKKEYQYIRNNEAVYKQGSIQVKARNKNSNTVETLKLLPIGRTILRQAAFKE
ncbi:glycoside hydrolase family 127 protein [Niabella sp. CC-SYL272]|uniref:beta-L-arabinofuranosidase domain-containing protein n=1 Tax=Niabella agricola TaxID=2891571 RepID=UPI001F2D470B|nr:beta-L-arabinofuranosidase domain-containing protein [Niabella agricola]MCF3110172.1 glycoside hydrolase family 127 protein [Niabella agricola]